MSLVLEKFKLGRNPFATARIAPLVVPCRDCSASVPVEAAMEGRDLCGDCAEEQLFRGALQASYQEAPEGKAPVVDRTMAGKKVLVVEDDRVLNRLLSLRLREFGLRVSSAWDASAALTVARREMPDAILMDLGLPGGDGIGVMERLRNISALAFTPVLVLSGSESEQSERRALLAGARVFLRKPARIPEIVAELQMALA